MELINLKNQLVAEKRDGALLIAVPPGHPSNVWSEAVLTSAEALQLSQAILGAFHPLNVLFEPERP